MSACGCKCVSVGREVYLWLMRGESFHLLLCGSEPVNLGWGHKVIDAERSFGKSCHLVCHVVPEVLH